MDLRIDQEFERLIPALSAEELAQLETNLKAEGCRDPLSIWPTADGPPLLLDGHNRYTICSANNLPFDVVAVALDSREEAMRWIINNQLGRRNLTEEQKSALRGRRYNLEKRADAGHGDQKSGLESSTPNVAKQLGDEYQVSRETIIADGQFAEGLDALAGIRQDLPRSVTTRRSRQQTTGKKKAKVTKARVITVGKLIREQRVAPLPCMRRGDWQDFHILEALPILAEFPVEEHRPIEALLGAPPMPPAMAVQVLKNLRERGPEGRQMILALHASADLREQSLALTLAAAVPPEPDPQDGMAERLRIDLERVKNRLFEWRRGYPSEPWTDEVNTLIATTRQMWTALGDLQARIHDAHAERIAHYAQTSLSSGTDCRHPG